MKPCPLHRLGIGWVLLSWSGYPIDLLLYRHSLNIIISMHFPPKVWHLPKLASWQIVAWAGGLVVSTRNNHRIILPSKFNRLNPSPMPTPSSNRAPRLDVPQKNKPVPSDAREPGIVPRDGYIEHRVPVCVVSLDWGCCFDCAAGIGGWGRA